MAGAERTPPRGARQLREFGGGSSARRRLIVNADDFGRSEAINSSVIEAHRRGILTTASLMVAGEAFEDAVRLARENPGLGVGLHLTACCGRAVLPHHQIPSLVNREGKFSDAPVAAGLRYALSPKARFELAREIRAQLERFVATGLLLDHVNGHLHFHLHPSIFPLLASNFAEFGVKAVRLTHDPLRIDWPLGRGRHLYRLSHWLIFWLLSRRARPALEGGGIRHARYVFGLLENDRVTEDYVLELLRVLPPGDSELYAHPSLDERAPDRLREHAALTSARVRNAVGEQNVQLIRYQDL